jgi:putative transposase
MNQDLFTLNLAREKDLPNIGLVVLQKHPTVEKSVDIARANRKPATSSEGTCMMQNLAFSLWCDRLHLSEDAQKVIQQVRSSEPVRRRQSRVGNWTGRYPSRKMGKTIQFESRTEEFSAVITHEYDETILEYYDQPSKIELRYLAQSGRSIVIWNTPDFFVLRPDRAGWQEWKPEEKLVELAQTMPNRYCRDEQGQWRCPPGEAYASRYGLTYEVCSSARLNPIYVRNLRFLQGYLRNADLEVDPAALKVMQELFAVEPIMTLEELLAYVEASQIYSALLLNHFSVDLFAAPLAEIAGVHIFRDSEVARAYLILAGSLYLKADEPAVSVSIGQGIVWDRRAWTVYNQGETSFALRSERGDWVQIPAEEFHALVREGVITQPLQNGNTGADTISDEETVILAKAKKQDYQAANRRNLLLQRYLSGEKPEVVGVPYRTLHDWEEKWKEAERTYGHGYIGLISKYQRSGNTQHVLPEETHQAMSEFIQNDYETNRQKPKMHSWGQFVAHCQANGIHPPSYKTYCKAINQRRGYEQTFKRKGRRAAYQERVPYLILDQGTPRHGDFPWQVVHLDHDLLDIQLRCSRTGKVLGKPWATVMTDAYSRRVLAVYLTYDPPSHRSDMMVLRECVRRHGRLPQTLVVDGGADFNSTYFEALLAFYTITKWERPAAEPRAGSVIERLFGTTNTSFLYNMVGNTQGVKKTREATPSIDPKRHATWTLAALYRRLCEWAYDTYDTRYHSALERTPREEFEAGMVIGGVRPAEEIKYDLKFLMKTMPAPEREKAKVIRRKGVQIHYEFYWSDKFLSDKVVGTEVEVRYDPFDVSRIFAFIQGEWTACRATHFTLLRHHSMREWQMLSAELRKRRSVSAQQVPLTAKHIADFLASAQAEEQVGMQRLCDAEMRDILQAIDLTYAQQFSLFQSPEDLNSQASEEETETTGQEMEAEELYGDYD